MKYLTAIALTFTIISSASWADDAADQDTTPVWLRRCESERSNNFLLKETPAHSGGFFCRRIHHYPFHSRRPGLAVINRGKVMEIKCGHCLTSRDVDLTALPHVSTTCITTSQGDWFVRGARRPGSARRRRCSSLLGVSVISRTSVTNEMPKSDRRALGCLRFSCLVFYCSGRRKTFAFESNLNEPTHRFRSRWSILLTFRPLCNWQKRQSET
jgi:hypothetical protein